MAVEPEPEARREYAEASRLAVTALQMMPRLVAWSYDEEGKRRLNAVHHTLLAWVDADPERPLAEYHLRRFSRALSALTMAAGLALEQAETRGIDRFAVLAEIEAWFDRFEAGS
jgi:hypothetical protein